MDNDFDDIDYEYYDNCDNQDLDIYDEDNVDIYDDIYDDTCDDIYEMSDELDDYVDYYEQAYKESFITNIQTEDKFAMDKAIIRSNLNDIVYINDVAYKSSGSMDRNMISIHSDDKCIDLTNLWNTFELIKTKEKSLINLAEYIYFAERKRKI